MIKVNIFIKTLTEILNKKIYLKTNKIEDFLKNKKHLIKSTLKKEKLKD
jgi:hypothetical protein